MCDGCFFSRWQDMDDLDFDEGGERQANERLRAYLAALTSERRAAIDQTYADLMLEGFDGWAGSILSGALHAAIDDDNYCESYRDVTRWGTMPSGQQGHVKIGELWLAPEQMAILDRWDALDENERSIVVGFLSEYQMLAKALA